MRGLPVPRAKQIYIMRDTKREAERLGMPFGRVVDPVGPGVERGLAVLHHAIAEARGPEFVELLLRWRLRRRRRCHDRCRTVEDCRARGVERGAG